MNWLDKLAKYISEYLEKRRKKKEPITIPTNPPVTPPVTPSVPTGTDALPWETIHWEGGNHAGVGKAALPVKVLRSAKVKGNMVYLDYDQTDDWGLKDHKDGDNTWQSYARLCAFSDHKDGALRGAHFDWLSIDGSGKAQKAKVLSNIYNGYLFGSTPPVKGGMLWFAIISNDGKKRTNLVAKSEG